MLSELQSSSPFLILSAVLNLVSLTNALYEHVSRFPDHDSGGGGGEGEGEGEGSKKATR